MESRCRLCAEEKTNFACAIDDQCENIREMLLTCCRWSSFESTEYENLPIRICLTCFNTLKQSWQFSCTVANAQQELLEAMKMLENTKTEVDFLAVDLQSIIPNPIDTNYTAFDLKEEANTSGTDDINHFALLDVVWNNDDDHDIDTKDFEHLTVPEQSHSTEYATVSGECSKTQTKQIEDIDSYNEMRREFKLMDNVREEECNPDGTIKEEAVQRLRLHDWTFIKYRCYVCQNILPSCVTLRHHFKDKHPNDVFKQVCMFCDYQKESEYTKSTTSHITRFHLPYLKYCCTLCSQYFWDMKVRNKHAVQSHIEHENRSYLCETCGQAFDSRPKYQKHQTVHMEKKPPIKRRTFECYLCKNAFLCKVSVVRHMWKHVVTDHKPFACDKCGTKFTRLMSLRRHALIHAGKNPHVCNMCGKEFRTKYNLDVHFRIHTGEKPYACSVCDYRTSDGPNLHKHMKTKHGMLHYRKTNQTRTNVTRGQSANSTNSMDPNREQTMNLQQSLDINHQEFVKNEFSNYFQ